MLQVGAPFAAWKHTIRTSLLIVARRWSDDSRNNKRATLVRLNRAPCGYHSQFKSKGFTKGTDQGGQNAHAAWRAIGEDR
jgi:hypothetical protein